MKKKTAKKKTKPKGKATRKNAASKPQKTVTPVEWYTITDPEQVKLIANDLRSRILIEFAKEELTAKQVAERLGESPTKFYRHVAALAEHGLIVPTREEKKRGTLQQFYRAVGRRFRVDNACFAGDESLEESKVGMVFQLLNTISSEITDSAKNPDEDYVAALTSPFRAPASRMDEIGKRVFDALVKVFEEFEPELKPGKSDIDYRVSLFIHPSKPTSARKKTKKRKQNHKA